MSWYDLIDKNGTAVIPSNGKMMSLVLRLYSQLLEHPSQL